MRGSLILLALVAATATARAEDGEPAITPLPRRALTIGMLGHGGRMSGLNEGGFGPNLELALGSGRWQYFTELGAAWVTLGGPGVSTDGFQARGGLGARWLARSMDFDGSAAIEMHLEGFAGLSEYWWSGGGRLRRADLGAGVGWQVRFLRTKQLAVRMTVRVYFAPDDPEPPKLVCAGACPMPRDAGSNSGLMVLLGFQW